MNLQEEFYYRIDNDNGYDNKKLGDDLIAIAKNHLSKQFVMSGVFVISGVRLSLPDEDEINSMQLEMDCPTPNEEEYTTSGFKSGVRWLKNTIERQMLKGNEA
jgi:hypothetical protein